jgi:hypothetical protein
VVRSKQRRQRWHSANSGPKGRRLDFILIRLVEARNGWRGKQPIDEVIDAVLDEIVAVANGHRWRLFASALSRGIQPAVRH